MTTDSTEIISYLEPSIADDYRQWDDSGSWLFGYSFLPLALGLDRQPGARLLDLGCGPGEVTRWLADRCDVRILAIDSSPAMIALAGEHAAHERVEYRLAEGALLPFLTDGELDAAMACFLFTCVDEEEHIRELIAEVARVVRPGGRFTILVPNPDHVSGAVFEGFKRGEDGAFYEPGELMPVEVQRVDGSWTTIKNRYWNRETYRTALVKAGFEGGMKELAPVLADTESVADPALRGDRAWARERTAAPFLLLTATR
ncbi:ubiquinone/menaquinone biosynthesis C-methylase UbiE [Streptacidiphilus sp. MAP12-20]|uniref:class I SAM-dependent methyltransferase n=1 Tax=Streptacidiphilus sp. MAP12-20 TaxID=3156299 RepID=UPI0035168559